MQVPQSSVIVAVVVLGSAAYGLTRDPPPSESHAIAAPMSTEPLPDTQDMSGEGANRPPDDSDEPGPDDEPAALDWTVPPVWPEVPNPSPMRIATHRIPHVTGDAQDAELSIARAGGDADANIERWMGQFSQSAAPRRSNKTVHGLAVTVVALEGTYEGGMGVGSGPHPGWGMMAAIVDTQGLHYFFKLTGPAATVRAARPSFQAMLDSVRPATP